MNDEYQKILGAFVFNSLDKAEGINWQAFAAFLCKLAERLERLKEHDIDAMDFIKAYMTQEAIKFFEETFCRIIKLKQEKPEETYYHVGQRFMKDGDEHEYILAQHISSVLKESIRKDDKHRVSLLDITDGCQFNVGIIIKNPSKITAEEFKKICNGEDFYLVEDNEDE